VPGEFMEVQEEIVMLSIHSQVMQFGSVEQREG